MNRYQAFNRAVLKTTVADAKARGAVVSDAWVHKTGNTWEFHYRDFCWWGRAEDAYDARAKGWNEWITKQIEDAEIQESST
jgi:hypothetical protein